MKDTKLASADNLEKKTKKGFLARWLGSKPKTTAQSKSENDSRPISADTSTIGSITDINEPPLSETIDQIDFDAVSPLALLANYELEPSSLDYIINTILLDPRYKSFVSTEQSDYLIALAAATTVHHLESQHLTGTIHPVWNIPVHDFNKVAEHLQYYVEKTVESITRNQSSLKKTPSRAVGRTSRWSETGNRESNEDRHAAYPYLHELLSKQNISCALSFYAIYDGHGGNECADFIAKHLHVNLARHPYLVEPKPAASNEIKRAIIDSFKSTNEQWREKTERCNFALSTGSTAVTALIQDRTIFFAWAGDSSALVFLKSGVWLDFVVPHKPTFESEKVRIANAGGFVQNNRVNGILAVSRSFGDFKYGCVTPEPEIMEYTLTGNESFLLLACDGLTDVFEPSDIFAIVSKYQQDHADISRILAEEALIRGSNDNVSVIYVSLDASKVPLSQQTAAVTNIINMTNTSTQLTRDTRTTKGSILSSDTASSIKRDSITSEVEPERKRQPSIISPKITEQKLSSNSTKQSSTGTKQTNTNKDHHDKTDPDWRDDDTPPELDDVNDLIEKKKLPSVITDEMMKSSELAITHTSTHSTEVSRGSLDSPVSSNVAMDVVETATDTSNLNQKYLPKGSPIVQKMKVKKGEDAVFSELQALAELSRQLASISKAEK